MNDFPERKRHRGEEDVSEEQMETESGLFGRRAPPQHKTETAAVRKNQQVGTEVKNTTARMPDERSDSNCVFVSNLAFNLEDPEGKMKAAFGGCGTVVQVRPVFAAKGAFRGYCYVQFEDELAAQEALRMDRQEMDGRPMFVSPCVDKSKNPDFKVRAARTWRRGARESRTASARSAARLIVEFVLPFCQVFKYNTSMEKHKIFISGLPFSCTTEMLEELCKEHGTVKAVRLVTNRSGKPKARARGPCSFSRTIALMASIPRPRRNI